jgi:hypothetical protein
MRPPKEIDKQWQSLADQLGMKYTPHSVSESRSIKGFLPRSRGKDT